MKASEARAQIALLQAYYPGAGRELPNSTVTLWAGALEPHDIGDVSQAVQQLVLRSSWMPSLADLEAEIAEIRDARLMLEVGEALALPPAAEERFCSFEDFLRTHPEERERVRRLGIWRDVLERSEQDVPQVAAGGGK